MIVIGVDPPTGWAVLDGERVASFGEMERAEITTHIARLIALWEPRLVIVEMVERVHPVRRKGVDGISTTQTLALIHGARAGERVLCAAEYGKVPTQEVAAEAWRKAITGNARADNATIERVLRGRLGNFPAPRKSNDHERDAMGVALFGVLRARLANQRRAG